MSFSGRNPRSVAMPGTKIWLRDVNGQRQTRWRKNEVNDKAGVISRPNTQHLQHLQNSKINSKSASLRNDQEPNARDATSNHENLLLGLFVDPLLDSLGHGRHLSLMASILAA